MNWESHFLSPFLSAGLLPEFHHHAACHSCHIPICRPVQPHAVLQVALRVSRDPP